MTTSSGTLETAKSEKVANIFMKARHKNWTSM